MTDLTAVLTDSPRKVGDLWENFQNCLKVEKEEYAQAVMSWKAKLKGEGMAASPATEEAKYRAETEENYIQAYITRVDAEAQYRKASDEQINSRKLAELARGGL